MTETVRDNAALGRFELDAEGHTALLNDRSETGAIVLVHTEVPKELGGRGIGSTLVRGVLDMIRARGLKVVAECTFVRAFMQRHPEYNDLLR